MNNYFLPQFCPLDTIQVKTRVIDYQIFQILFQTTTSHYITTHTRTTKSRLRLNYILLIKNEWTNSFSIMIFKPPPLQIHDKTKNLKSKVKPPRTILLLSPLSSHQISNCVNSSQPAITRPPWLPWGYPRPPYAPPPGPSAPQSPSIYYQKLLEEKKDV